MRFGINLLLWGDALSEELLPRLEQVKKLGFDLVEIPLFDSNLQRYEVWGRHLDNAGLARTAATVREVEDNPMSPDPAVRRKGVEANKVAREWAKAAGCELLCGPYHSAIGYFTGTGPTLDEWRWAVESMQQVAEYAESCDIDLALEYLNRFECYLLNTAADGARFVAEVGHPRTKMMYDTFHSHIEEKNTTEAIYALKDCLGHVHISENDRGTPGAGNVHWAETFDALRAIDYNSTMVIEAFGSSLEKLLAATKIWRPLYESELQLARDGLAFMKTEVNNRW